MSPPARIRPSTNEPRRSFETCERDLQLILRYIALDNPSAAFRWIVEVDDVFQMLAAHPLVGEALHTPRLGRVRRFTHGQYVIYFRPLREGVHIVRVFHGAREQEGLI